MRVLIFQQLRSHPRCKELCAQSDIKDKDPTISGIWQSRSMRSGRSKAQAANTSSPFEAVLIFVHPNFARVRTISWTLIFESSATKIDALLIHSSNTSGEGDRELLIWSSSLILEEAFCRGKVTLNEEPLPTVLSTLIVPFNSSVSVLLIDRPRID